MSSFIRVGLTAIPCALPYSIFWTNQQNCGNIFEKMKNITVAIFRQREIEDECTRKMHVKTVLELSAGDSIYKWSDLTSAFYDGDLPTFLNGSTPVFSFWKELQTFNVAGPLNYLYYSSDRRRILEANYVRCPGPIDAIIVGTKDTSLCQELKKFTLWSAAWRAEESIERYQNKSS